MLRTRIGINTRFLLDSKLEGIGLFTKEVFKRVAVLMPEVDFYFFFDRKPSQLFVNQKNIKEVVLWPQARHPILWYIWFENSIPKALRKYEIDLFVSPDGYLSLHSQVPTILTIHDLAFFHFKEHLPWVVHKYFNYFTPKFAGKAKHIITVSEFSKQDISARYGVRKEGISVVGNGCDEAIHPLDESQQQLIRSQYANNSQYFVYIGAIHPRKNIKGLLLAFDAFKAAYECSIKLVLVGRWAWKTGETKRLFRQMKFGEDVIHLGHLERTDLSKVLGASLALVYPSFFEGFGIPLLEAMYAEVPIITSNRSSLPEVAGDAALYIDPDNLEELKNSLITMAKDLSLRKELIQKGIIQRAKFSWDKTAEMVVQIIRDQLRKNKKRE